jgi:sensor histidine kinase YesM
MGNMITALVGLNRAGERDRLEEALVSLSRLFYYAESGDKLVPVGRECDFVEAYLALQKLRFEDRLSYLVSVQEAAREVPVPRSLLLSLVENAVVYGIEPMENAGRVTLTCMESGVDLVEIIVEDSGPSFGLSEAGPRARCIRETERRLLLFSSDSSIRAGRSASGSASVRILMRVGDPTGSRRGK